MTTKTAERVIVAADFKPGDGGIDGVYAKVLELAEELRDTGVIIKVNSALRACGYGLIQKIHEFGVKVAADLKIVDIPETMQTDGLLLADYRPDFLTVMANAGPNGMRVIRDALPNTEVWGVTVLTSLDQALCREIYGKTPAEATHRLALMAKLAGLPGLILSPLEAEVVRAEPDLSDMILNTPGIRYPWSEVGDQKRFATAGEAILKGVTRVVVGRPILNAKPNNEGRPQGRLEALDWIVKDIDEALAKKGAV